MGGWDRVLVAGLIAGSAAGVRAEDAGPRPVAACRFEVVGAGRVARVLDGSSFVLADGREVRLAAIEAPPLRPPDARGEGAAGLAATTALEAILAGASIDLRQHGPATDRYGRTVAFAYLTLDGTEHSAAHDLVARGHARVTAHIGNTACAAELLSRE